MASHAIGKTFLAAVAANWWYDCWDEHIVYVTAPNWSQALGLTFKYTKQMRREKRLPGIILETGLIKDADKMREGAHFIKALNAERGEGFQGEHSAPILIIIEEGVGVPGYIWEAADGLMTHPDCRTFVIGNPTDESTPFGEACNSSVYDTFSISALHHPNILAELNGEPPPFPKAVRLQWVMEMLEKECERTDTMDGDAFEFPEGSGEFWLPNATFQGRVLGLFPTQADQQVIPRGWLQNLPVLESSAIPEIGCDMARFGTDRTVIAVRQGRRLLSVKEIRKMDQDTILGELLSTAKDAAKLIPDLSPKKIRIKIDVTGGLGTGPADTLINQGYNVDPVNSSQKANDEENFPNRRSELWFAVRDYARTRELDFSPLPRDLREKLIRELSTPTYKNDNRGRKLVEPKEKIKERLGASPDLADGVNLAFCTSPELLPFSQSNYIGLGKR